MVEIMVMEMTFKHFWIKIKELCFAEAATSILRIQLNQVLHNKKMQINCNLHTI